MDSLTGLLIVQAALTAVAAALLLWRGMLDMREEDQLILDDAESHLMREQGAIRQKVKSLTKYIRVVTTAWGVMAVVILAVWVANGLDLV